jgi:tetratricopeptide (TPR) repeat protein
MEFFLTLLERFYALIGVTGLLIGGSAALCIVLLFAFLNARLNVFRKAVKQYEKGNFGKALFYIAIVLQRHPTYRQAMLLKARIESKHGAYREAEEQFFRLIDLKKPGDGIDVFEIKTELLVPLYAQHKLYETYKLCKEILTVSHTNAEALYYMGLIYLGQLSYREAEKILSILIKNRPRHHEALCAAGVAAAQLGGYERAESYMKKSLDIEKKPLSTLLYAGVLFFLERYSQALLLLDFGGDEPKYYQKKEQLLFSLRLKAFCAYKLTQYEKAAAQFKKIVPMLDEGADSTPPQHNKIATYNDFGKLKKPSRTESAQTRVQNSAIRDYYRLKEVAIEEGKGTLFGLENASFFTRLLDIEGLSTKTWSTLDVGFSLVRGGLYSEAKAFFQEVQERHPEVLGLKRIIEMIDEKLQEHEIGTKKKEGLREVEKSTQKILQKKARSFELWEYVEAWEKTVIRPYHLLRAGGYTARVQLKPSLLVMKDGRFPWQL